MKELMVADLKPGMSFDKPLYLQDGNLVVQAGTQLSEEDIERLEKWGIDMIQTDGEMMNAPPAAVAAAADAADDGDGFPDLEISLAPGVAAPTPAAAPKAPPTAAAPKLEPKPRAADPYATEKERLKQLKRMNELRMIAQRKKEIIKRYAEKVDATRETIEALSTGAPMPLRQVDELVAPLVVDVPKYKNIYIGCALQRGSASEYLFTHSLNVCIFSLVIGLGYEYSKAELHELALGAILHDVGMLKVPKHIREKKRRLEESEYNLIKTHPIHGYRIMTKYKDFNAKIQAAVLQHHESYDGTGYPQKMSGEAISEYARIISVADVFDALTKKRSWREESKGYDAMRNILQESKSKFDARALRIFLANMAIYPIGSVVQLNTMEFAVVIDANEKTPLRPTVKVIFDGEKKRLREPRILDLISEPTMMISRSVDREELDISAVEEL